MTPQEPDWIGDLDVTLDELFALFALAGAMAAQQGRPDLRYIAEFALDLGTTCATLARARRPKRE